jgi:mono/diheme cytochrome c family protein
LLQKVKSPFRIDETGNSFEGIEEKYLNANLYEDTEIPYVKFMREGGEIYFQECHFCHGANLNGKGISKYALNPIAADFSDPGTIAQHQENYVFWKVAKGGIGMPRGAFPWAIAMPGYENHISTNDMWKVIEFIYWETGWYPGTWN